MKAKLTQDYRFSLDGLVIHDLSAGTVVEGEIAKRFAKAGIAKETKAKDAVAEFNDDGPIIVEEENVIESLDEAMAIIKQQSLRIEALEKQLGELTAKGEASEPKPDGDDNTETDDTTG